MVFFNVKAKKSKNYASGFFDVVVEKPECGKINNESSSELPKGIPIMKSPLITQ